MYNCMLIDVFQFLNMKKIAGGRLSEKGLDQMFTVQIRREKYSTVVCWKSDNMDFFLFK